MDIKNNITKEEFIKIVESNDIENFKLLPKSDLHIHSSRGCPRNAFEKLYNIKFPDVPIFKNLTEMNNWYDKYIDKYARTPEGFDIRMKHLLYELKKNSVVYTSPIYCMNMIKYFNNNFDEYIKYLKENFETILPNTMVFPEFEIFRGEDPDKVEATIEKVNQYKFYRSIDLCGDEKLGCKQYQKIYDKARKLGLVLKVHIGEFGTVEDIDEALEYLKPDCIIHGNSLIESKELMKYVRENEIMINCCPSSNYYLSVIKEYNNHPIKEFVRNGIICTINTDDQLIFNNSISDEYFNLFFNNCLTAEELYEVNQNGLKRYLNRRKI